jgi:hypothetical protein
MATLIVTLTLSYSSSAGCSRAGKEAPPTPGARASGALGAHIERAFDKISSRE